MTRAEFRRWLKSRGWKLQPGERQHEHWMAPNGGVMMLSRGTGNVDRNAKPQAKRIERDGSVPRKQQEVP